MGVRTWMYALVNDHETEAVQLLLSQDRKVDGIQMMVRLVRLTESVRLAGVNKGKSEDGWQWGTRNHAQLTTRQKLFELCSSRIKSWWCMNDSHVDRKMRLIGVNEAENEAENEGGWQWEDLDVLLVDHETGTVQLFWRWERWWVGWEDCEKKLLIRVELMRVKGLEGRKEGIECGLLWRWLLWGISLVANVCSSNSRAATEALHTLCYERWRDL